MGARMLRAFARLDEQIDRGAEKPGPSVLDQAAGAAADALDTPGEAEGAAALVSEIQSGFAELPAAGQQPDVTAAVMDRLAGERRARATAVTEGEGGAAGTERADRAVEASTGSPVERPLAWLGRAPSVGELSRSRGATTAAAVAVALLVVALVLAIDDFTPDAGAAGVAMASRALDARLLTIAAAAFILLAAVLRLRDR